MAPLTGLAETPSFVPLPPPCGGKNLYLAMTAEQRNAIDSAAISIINGRARFWRVDKGGVESSWILGTMHASDPRVRTLSRAEEAALHHSARVALELKEIAFLSRSEMSQRIFKNGSMWRLVVGNELEQRIGTKTFRQYQTALKGLGYPIESAKRLQPWLIWQSISLPKCELARQEGGAPTLDELLGHEAIALDIPVIGLESIYGQLKMFASLPVRAVVEEIIAANQIGPTARRNLFTTLVELYAQGKIATFLAFAQSSTPKSNETIAPDELMTKLISDRNASMTEAMIPLLVQGNSFIAVGAAHLPGIDGIIERLKRKGYKITPYIA